MSDDLSSLESWAQPLIENVAPTERRKLMRRLSIGLRQRQRKRIADQKNPDGSPFAPRRPRKQSKKGRIKRKRDLFLKLRQARHMKAVSSADGLSVGFTGRTAHIARIHQEGQLSQLSLKGALYQYPSRKILGFTAEDRAWLESELVNHIIG